jgi:hypothetical protein
VTCANALPVLEFVQPFDETDGMFRLTYNERITDAATMVCLPRGMSPTAPRDQVCRAAADTSGLGGTLSSVARKGDNRQSRRQAGQLGGRRGRLDR